MHGKGRHARIELPIAKRQSLRNCIDRGWQMARPQRPHRFRRLNRRDATISRLIGTSASANIEHRLSIAQRIEDKSRDTRVRLPIARVATSNDAVIRVPGAPISMPETQLAIPRY